MKPFICIPVLCLALLFGLVASATARTARFATRNLQQMAERLQSEYGIDCTRPGTPAFGQNRLVVTADPLRRIDHIGLAIFPEQIIRENPSPVYRFVERYLLELYLFPELPTPEQRLNEDNVTLRFPASAGGNLREDIARHLPRFGDRTSLLVLTDNHRYSVTVYESGKTVFAMRFPIRYELLWGMNKIEAENGFYETLLQYQAPRAGTVAPLPGGERSFLKPDGGGTFVLTGEDYWISSVNSNRYYRLAANGEYLPVYDRRQADESLRNLFQLPELAPNITVTVKQRLYSRRSVTFDISLYRLLSYCRTTGCHTYVGIETCTADSITGIVVLLNPAYGYCHQLYFEADTRMVDKPGRYKMAVELYAYVPTHNIGNLFNENENNNLSNKQEQK